MKNKLYIVGMSICLLIFAISAYQVFHYYADGKQQREEFEKLSELVEQTQDEFPLRGQASTIQDTYIITYDANGGSGTMEKGTATEGVAFTLPENGFSAPEGKQFKEWAVGSVDGTRVRPGERRNRHPDRIREHPRNHPRKAQQHLRNRLPHRI